MNNKKLTQVQKDTLAALKNEFKGSTLVYSCNMNGYRPSSTTMNALVRKGFLCLDYTEKIPYEVKSENSTHICYELRTFYRLN